MPDSPGMCRICHAAEAAWVETVEYIAGYAWDVFECRACGCRFTRHDDATYELMHQTGVISYYSDYKGFARICQEYFSCGDKQKLRAFLAANSKYRFVIEAIDAMPSDARLLEIGSSRGYLTSCFILDGRDVLGVDVSTEAVAEAKALFGEHFAVAGEPRIAKSGPYDLVYHVGLIGCVGDPVGMTRDLLALLKPGGKLIFNAPNSAALHLRGQAWVDTAPPPDVVTLFPEGFWKKQFSAFASVTESVERLAPENTLVIGLRRLFGLRWRRPAPKAIGAAGPDAHVWSQSWGPAWSLFERVCLKLARVTGLVRLAPARPTDFGLFVTMKRK